MRVYDSTGRLKVLQEAAAGSGASSTAVVSSVRNLIVRSVNTTSANFVADEAVIKHGVTAAPLLLKNLNINFDIVSGVGLNGFETGAARGVSRWFYVWLISDGTNARVVLDDAGAGDGTMPGTPDLSAPAFAGYVYMGLMGQIRLNATGSGEIVQFVQFDRSVWIEDTTIFSPQAAVADNVWEVLAGTQLTNFRACVPPTGKTCTGTVGNTVAGGLLGMGVAACNSDGSLNSTNPPGPLLLIGGAAGSLFAGSGAAMDYFVPVRGGAGRNIQWKGIRVDAVARHRLLVSGYTF